MIYFVLILLVASLYPACIGTVL